MIYEMSIALWSLFFMLYNMLIYADDVQLMWNGICGILKFFCIYLLLFEWRFNECIILFYELTSGSKFNVLFKWPIKHKLCSIFEYLKCFMNITFLSISWCICWICASRIVWLRLMWTLAFQFNWWILILLRGQFRAGESFREDL